MTRIISSVPRQTMEIRSSLARYRSALRKRFCLAAVPTSVKFTSSSARMRISIFDNASKTSTSFSWAGAVGRNFLHSFSRMAAVQPRFFGNAGALQIEDRRRDRSTAGLGGLDGAIRNVS